MSDTLPRTYRQPSFRGQIGIARTDITPPVGIYSRNWGAAAHDVADSIHRSLTLTALTLSTGPDQPPLVLVDADLGWWRGLDVFRRFQKQVLDALDLEAGQLIFALSHTHAGPPLMDADEALPGCDILKTWMEELPRATIATVRDALAAPFDGIIDWTTGRCTLATVRDLPDPDPKADRFLCGYSPEGEPDDTLIVGRITDSAGQMRATLVNYACHPTTLAWDNTAISPDYIGAMRQTMQDVTGAPAMFLLGRAASWHRGTSTSGTRTSRTGMVGSLLLRHWERSTTWSHQQRSWSSTDRWNRALHLPSGSTGPRRFHKSFARWKPLSN